MSSGQAVVFVMDDQNHKPVSPPNFEKAKLIFFSEHASKVLGWGRANQHKNRLFLPQAEANREAAIVICKWMADNDVNNRKPLIFPGEYIYQACYLYQTAHCFRLNLALRGDDIRDWIDEYIHQPCLSLDEFVMIHELVWFDTGLTYGAKQQVMFCKAKGGKYVCPQHEDIMAYCRETGMEEEMLKIGKEIQEKFEKSEKSKMDGQKKQVPTSKEQYDETFPSLS